MLCFLQTSDGRRWKSTCFYKKFIFFFQVAAPKRRNIWHQGNKASYKKPVKKKIPAFQIGRLVPVHLPKGVFWLFPGWRIRGIRNLPACPAFSVGSGTYENIITNLFEEEFHAEDIRKRYCLRWRTETSSCTLKHAIAAMNFHSKNRQMIIHDVWARLIFFNFCFYITGQVTFEKQKRKHIHQVDFSVVSKICRHFLRLHSDAELPDVSDLIGTLSTNKDSRYQSALHTDFNWQSHCTTWQVFFISAYLLRNKTITLLGKWHNPRRLF